MSAKILLIDDSLPSLYLTASILREHGMEVAEAAGVQEAFELARNFSPDIVVTDWMLHDTKNGVEVAETLVSAFPGIRIIFLTGYPIESLREELEDRFESCENYVVMSKPIEPDSLVALMG